MTAAGGSREERWSLAGTTALVTGGSKGIGHAIVEELAGFGARVHTCSRNAAELEECRRRWAEKKLQVTVSVCDVSVRAEREMLMETVKESFHGKLDILVNNVAQLFFKAAAEYTSEEYSHMMATNLESSFHLSQLARPLLLNASIAGGGNIVNISSIGGSLAYPGLALYSITKDRAGCPGARVLADPDAAERRAGGGRVGGVVSLYASGFLRHRPGHLHRRRPNNYCLISN